MSATFWVWFGIAIYIAVGLAIALMARRRLGAGVSEFFLANRRVGGFVSALTYSATTYSAFMMIGLAGLTYFSGVGALGFELTYLCGMFMMVFFLPRFWLAGKKYGYISPMELLSDRYQNKGVGATAGILALVFLVPYGAVQLMGVGYLMNGVSDGAIPVVVGIIIAVVCAIAWSSIAGLRSVAWTDAFQALVMIVTSAVVLGVVVNELGGFGSFFSRLEAAVPELLRVTAPGDEGPWKLHMFIGLALPWLFFLISNPQVSQRLFIPKSVTAMKQMLGGFLIFGFIYTLISVLWGFGAILLVPGVENADKVTPALLALPIIPTGLAIVVLIGITAAAISTIDSILLTLSSVWARDIHKGLINPKVSEAKQLRIGQWVIPIMAIIAFVFAWWAAWAAEQPGDMLELMIAPLASAASAGLLMAVPTIFGAFFWKRATASGAIVSCIVGAIVVLVLQILSYPQVLGWKPLGWWPGTWGFVVCVPLFIGVSLATKPPREKAEEFIGYLKGALKKGRFI